MDDSLIISIDRMLLPSWRNYKVFPNPLPKKFRKRLWLRLVTHHQY